MKRAPVRWFLPILLRSGAILLALAVAAAAPAAAAGGRLTSAQRQAIGRLVDAFVKDAVLRENLAAAWELAGPDLRGGTTRSAWIHGNGVTVPAFPARGSNFSHAWTGQLVGPGHAQLSLILEPRPGSGYDETAVSMDVRRYHGRWLVDLFYSAAVFRGGHGKSGSCGSANCAISGPNDYGPGAAASAPPPTKAGGHFLLIALASLAAVVVLVPVAIWVRLRVRTRRIWAEYRRAHG